MFVRRKANKSGSFSVQIIDKTSGKYRVIKTIGCSNNNLKLRELELQAKQFIKDILQQESLNFLYSEEQTYITNIVEAINSLQLAGPELILGKIFDKIGFNRIKDELFRHLVISRICYPASKLKTVDYLYRYKGLLINIQRIYRYLDKLNNKQKIQVQEISYNHTLRISENVIRVVFYDVTTLYFETDKQDEFRVTGFSKEGKHSNPQIILGLLISSNGDPLAYEIYEGNKYEGYTMIPIIESFAERYKIKQIVIVADSGLISERNIKELKGKGYEYIIGARIRNEKEGIKQQILSLKLSNGEVKEIVRRDGSRLIVSYSEKRAKKDELNRRKGVEKLEKKIRTGKLTKTNINNKGYNKFLAMEGNINIRLDWEKIEKDSIWDGIKGYITNTNLIESEVILQYNNLWQIEKAFRISKSDLRIRPIYHRLRHRIEAHICIAFCAYKVYKELERQLRINNINLSVENAIEIVNTIYKVEFFTPVTKTKYEKIIIKNNHQAELLKLIEKF